MHLLEPFTIVRWQTLSLRVAVASCFMALMLSVQATDVPAGNVSGTWTAAESPYLIQGNIRVPTGESLTIESGAEVVFNGPYFLRIRGSFSAVGNDADSVRFSWSSGQMNVSGIMLDSLDAASDTVRFDRCVFTAMQAGRIRIISADNVVVENSRFYGNVGHPSGLLFISNTTNVRISGNRFQNNNASASSSYGGVLYIYDSSPVISNNSFTGNSASWSGGAISIWRLNQPVTPLIIDNVFSGNSAPSGGAIDIRNNVVPHLENNLFAANHATVTGGAIWQSGVQAGTIAYINNQFIGNTTGQRGGAIRSINAQCSFEGNVFENNSTTNFSGGAIHFNNNNTASLTDCRFSGNGANNGAGIAFEDGGTFALDRCTFNNNTANSFGGAFFMQSNIVATFSNCLIVQNEAGNLGGAMRLVQFCSPTFVNCTFAGNHAANNSAVASLYWTSSPTFANTIWWGNTSGGNTQLVVQDYIQNFCVPIFDHALIEHGQTQFSMGTSSVGMWQSVLTEDPLFVNATAGAGAGFDALAADFRLPADGSPAIASGTLEGYNVGELDLDGNPRTGPNGVDLGCYAVTEPAPHPLDFNGDGSVDIEDFLLFLANFGCVGDDCVGDLTGDGMVSTNDLLLFLSLWSD